MSQVTQPESLENLSARGQKSGKLGSSLFSMDEAGNLALGALDRDIKFAFTVNKVPYAAKIREEENGPVLSLCGDLGYVPYSAQNNFARTSVLKIIRMGGALRQGHFKVRGDQRLLFFGQAGLSRSITQAEIVAAICKILMEARPYLTMIGDCMAFAIPANGFDDSRRPKSKDKNGGEEKEEGEPVFEEMTATDDASASEEVAELEE